MHKEKEADGVGEGGRPGAMIRSGEYPAWLCERFTGRQSANYRERPIRCRRTSVDRRCRLFSKEVDHPISSFIDAFQCRVKLALTLQHPTLGARQ